MLLTSFIASPCPSPPMWNTFLPIARKRSWHAATVSASPPTMMDSSPEVGPLGAAAHRRVHHRDAARRELLREPARHERIDRAHAGHDVPGPRHVDDAALARDDRLGLRGGLHHADRPIGLGRHLRGRGRQGGAARAPPLGLRRIDVVDHQGEAALDEVERHRIAHGAETDESDCAGHCARASLGVRIVRHRDYTPDRRPTTPSRRPPRSSGWCRRRCRRRPGTARRARRPRAGASA